MRSSGAMIVRAYFDWVTARPILVLCVAACVALVSGAFVFRLTRETSPDAFIPLDHPALAIKRQVDEAFGLREPVVIGVIHDGDGGVFNPDTLTLIRTLTTAIRQFPGIETDEVVSLATEYSVYFEEGVPGFAPLLAEVPTSLEGLLAVRNEILGYELYSGTLVSKDGTAAAILIRPRDEYRADNLYRELLALLDDPAVTSQVKRGEGVVVAGEAAVRAHMGVAVSDDALRMNFVCPVFMALLIIAAYRTVRGTVLPLCVIGGASALTLGSMAASGVPIYIVTSGIFVIIMALGVADSVHLVGQYYEEQLDLGGRDRRAVVVDACLAIWYPLLITTLTDVAGFFALFVAGVMPPIRYFGLFTCLGVVGAFFFSYTVVPASLAILPLRGSPAWRLGPARYHGASHLGVIARALRAVGEFTYQRRQGVLIVGAILIGVAAWGASKIVVNDARIFAFKDHHPIVAANTALNERFDGTGQLNIVVRASEDGAMLRSDVLRRIEQLEAFTESLAYVGGTHSLAGWVKRAHQKMNDDATEFYAIPNDPEDTRFYLDVLSNKLTSPMASLLNEIVDESYSRCNLIVRMRSSEFIHQRDVVERLERHLAESFNDRLLRAELSGRVHLDYHWLRMIRTTHLNSVALSVGCILVLTGLLFRSAIAGLLCTLTVGIAVLVIYAVMGFAGIPLGVGTSMFAAIAIGAGVNFPIHILDRLRVSLRSNDADPRQVFGETLAFTGRALFFTAFVVAAGFLLLCVSEFRTLVRFGLLIGIGMIVSFVASITVLPAIVACFRPRFVWGKSILHEDPMHTAA